MHKYTYIVNALVSTCSFLKITTAAAFSKTKVEYTVQVNIGYTCICVHIFVLNTC